MMCEYVECGSSFTYFVCHLQLRDVLSGMERRLRSRCSPSVELQRWLQLTYEVETRYFERKRLAADSQLKAAKDMVGPLSTSCSEFVVLDVFKFLMYKSVRMRMRMLLKIKIRHNKHVQHIIHLYHFKLISL